MCLAVPMKLLEVNGNVGVVEVGGVRRTADLSMVAPVSVGQYVIVHAGFALTVMDEEEAGKTIDLLNEMSRRLQGEEA